MEKSIKKGETGLIGSNSNSYESIKVKVQTTKTKKNVLT
jgi:hypothetical protein